MNSLSLPRNYQNNRSGKFSKIRFWTPKFGVTLDHFCSKSEIKNFEIVKF